MVRAGAGGPRGVRCAWRLGRQDARQLRSGATVADVYQALEKGTIDADE